MSFRKWFFFTGAPALKTMIFIVSLFVIAEGVVSMSLLSRIKVIELETSLLKEHVFSSPPKQWRLLNMNDWLEEFGKKNPDLIMPETKNL